MASVSKKTYYKVCVSETPITSAAEAYIQKKVMIIGTIVSCK